MITALKYADRPLAENKYLLSLCLKSRGGFVRRPKMGVHVSKCPVFVAKALLFDNLLNTWYGSVEQMNY